MAVALFACALLRLCNTDICFIVFILVTEEIKKKIEAWLSVMGTSIVGELMQQQDYGTLTC